MVGAEARYPQGAAVTDATPKENSVPKFLSAAVLLPALVLTTPAFADLKEDYMTACMAASGDNTELFTCKTEQAATLADEEMLGYLVAYLKDPLAFNASIEKGEVPQTVVDKWPYYVMKSNKACAAPTT
jgi:hypothetical protein